jgi:hypothetical protein
MIRKFIKGTWKTVTNKALHYVSCKQQEPWRTRRWMHCHGTHQSILTGQTLPPFDNQHSQFNTGIPPLHPLVKGKFRLTL